MRKYGLIIGLFLLAFLLVYLFGNDNDYVKVGNLYISEIVPINSYTIKNNYGEYSDYIEIYNNNNYDIDLEGYRLTDSIVDSKKWTFPSFIIKAHEYKIIYASGFNTCEDECHTNFKLSSDGETISLIDKTGNIISRVSYPKMNNDTSYSYVNGKYIITLPSPKEENHREEIKTKDLKDYKIKINEYMSHNKSASYAGNGGYYDFVELYNYGDEDLELKGFSLSDDPDNLNKFIIPEVTIKSKDYLVVYLTGKEEIDGSIYANFKLSDNDKKLVLSYSGKVIDSADVVKLEENMSYGMVEDKWYYFYKPTPGKVNDTAKKETLGGDKGGDLKDISP